MAFKPLDFFRKRQKFLLAGLTLMAIFLFIIGDAISMRSSSGGAGLAERIRRFFGADPAFATVDGHKLTSEEVFERAVKRLNMLRFVTGVEELGRVAVLRGIGFTDPEIAVLFQRSQDFQAMMSARQKVEEKRKSNPAAFDDLSLGSGSPTLDTVRRFSLSPEFLVAFQYWKDQADQLGIVVTPERVKRDLDAIGKRRLGETDLMTLARQVNREYEGLVKDLAEEVRAHLAYDVVMGVRPMEQAPLHVAITPYDLWQTYVRVKTALQVSILPLNVADKEFTGKVPEPTREQLKAFFDQYKDKLPDAAADTPGFRIPRLYQVDFVHVNIRETMEPRKYYQKWVEAASAMDPWHTLHGLVRMYNDRKEYAYKVVEPFLEFTVGNQPGQQMHQRVALLPGIQFDRAAAANWVANAAGQAADPAWGLLPAAVVLRPVPPETQPHESSERVAIAQTLASAAGAAFGLTNVLVPSQGLRLVQSEKYQPLEEVIGALRDEYDEEGCRQFLQADMRIFEKDLADYGKKYSEEYGKWRRLARRNQPGTAPFTPPKFNDQETIDAYIKRFATARGMTYEGTRGLRSEEDLLKEVGATPLNTFLKPLYAQQRPGTEDKALRQQLAAELTEGTKVFVVKPLGFSAPGSKPSEYAWFWKAEQTDERTPTFDEAMPKVREAWMLKEARKFAETTAQQMVKDVEANADNLRALKDRPGFADLETLGRYYLAPLQGTAPSMSYVPRPIPIIENPAPDFIETVMKDFDGAAKAKYYWNQPKTHLYVIVLKEKLEPKPTNPADLTQFDADVILPDRTRQMQVDGQPISQYAQQLKNARSFEAWLAYFRQYSEMDDAKTKELTDQLRQMVEQRR